MSSTVYVTHPRYPEHDLAEHPEHAGRIRAVWRRMEEGGLLPRLLVREAAPVTTAQIAAVHTPDLLRMLDVIAGQPHLLRVDADTYAATVSPEIARLSAGAVVDAVVAVLDKTARNGLAACRPPGHHAEAGRAMGFCLLANVSIAARFAQQQYGLQRVLILDYDVHHGNGTEAIFYEDPSVYFISTHQSSLYPGTGIIDDTGANRGEGYTLNLPLPGGAGDISYAAVFEQIVWPAVRRFAPELIIVSAGFDAHWLDPLAGMRLTTTGYAHLTRELIRMADEVCEGRIVFAMEGGYNLDALSHGMANIARLLLGDEPIDVLGTPTTKPEPDISSVIARIKTRHGL